MRVPSRVQAMYKPNLWKRSAHTRVSHFKYLGSIIKQDNDLKMEVTAIWYKLEYCGLGNMLGSKVLSKKLKIQLHIIPIRPIVPYDSETWTLRMLVKIRLAVFERKILRRFYGPCIDSGHWGTDRIQHNYELERLMWAGHVWSRGRVYYLKTVIKKNPVGKIHVKKIPLGKYRVYGVGWLCQKKNVEAV